MISLPGGSSGVSFLLQCGRAAANARVLISNMTVNSRNNLAPAERVTAPGSPARLPRIRQSIFLRLAPEIRNRIKKNRMITGIK